MKAIFIALLVLVIVGGGYYLYSSQTEKAADNTANESEGSTNTTSGMRAEENAVIATDQRPGTIVTVAQVYLAAPGYVIIHEDKDGEAGAIIGSSSLLKTGENNDVKVTLSRTSKDGEKLWAMLHSELNNNSVFEITTDNPVQSRLGGPIMGWFQIDATASENVQITI